MVQIMFFMLAAACYAVKSYLIHHNRQDGKYNRFYFFGRESWKRKYERHLTSGNGEYNLVAAPDTFYYYIFNIKYKERFFGSATIFLAATDGVQLTQFLFINFLILAILTCQFNLTVGTFLVLIGAWYLAFKTTYQILLK